MRIPRPCALLLMSALLTVDLPAQTCGDCDGDGVISILDALRAARLTFGHLTTTVEERLRCDVDSSTVVTVLDALLIAQLSAGLAVTPRCLAPRRWQLVERGGVYPELRGSSSLAYDSGRRVAVLVLCWSPFADTRTFEWDGVDWQERAQGTIVPPRAGTMVFDSIRGVCVLLDTVNSFVWHWDGVSWTSAPAPGPSQRYVSAAAFDSSRGVVVIHGGSYQASVDFHDTWEWDGVSWRQVATAFAPPDGSIARMTYDPNRDRVVLFGGLRPSTSFPPLQDTYEYDGVNWRLDPVSRLTTFQGSPNLAYDPSSARVLLSGLDTTGSMGVWRHDGAVWTPLPAAASPPPRVHDLATLDTDRDVLIHFGGRTPAPASCVLGETWEWDRASWTLVDEPRFPVEKEETRLSHHRASGTTVMTAGFATGTCIPTTCTWDGVSFALMAPGLTEPGELRSSSMVYDSRRARCVFFGGDDGADPNNRTWEWDGSSWTEAFPSVRPSPRSDHAMAYDEAGGEVVLYGGYHWMYPSAPEETWCYDGTTWTQRFPVTSPPQLVGHMMAFHAPTSRVVLFGGVDFAAFDMSGDTYTWNGSDWHLEQLPSGPPAFAFGGISYDEVRRNIVVVGGFSLFGGTVQTWEWDGQTWAQAVTSSPDSLYGMGMTYDARLDSTLLFGGRRVAGTFLGELWEYR